MIQKLVLDKPKRVLWVDDDIGGLAAMVRELQAVGFHVTPAASTEEATELGKKQVFDLILVDILMPPPDGIECLRRLHTLQEQAFFAVLSSFLYLPRYRAEIQQIGFPVEIIDKDAPFVEAPDFFERFLAPIIRFANDGVTNTLEQQQEAMEALESSGVNPFTMTLTDFLTKPLLEKDRLRQIAGDMAKETIDRAFKVDKKVWVLFCGSATQIRKSASSFEEILSDEDVMKFARVQQRAPFQFFKPIMVEDIWSETCRELSTRYYPTVVLEFRDQREQVVVHFDTGAPLTFFSYEELVRLKAIRPTQNFIDTLANGRSYSMVLFDIKVVLSGEDGGKSAEIVLKGQAVRDWLRAPFARFCDETCSEFNASLLQQLCKSRAGLVGRNVLIENALILILDGPNRKTRVG